MRRVHRRAMAAEGPCAHAPSLPLLRVLNDFMLPHATTRNETRRYGADKTPQAPPGTMTSVSKAHDFIPHEQRQLQ